MRFIQIINQRKFILSSIFLFLYIIFNLLDGERGLISYIEKQRIKEQLIQENELLSSELIGINKKNSLLTDKIDLDYLEMLYREMFMVGKKEEKIYKNDN